MTVLGYIFERTAFVIIAVPCWWFAIHTPVTYNFLTYWTLILHAVYFSIDKASPYAMPAIRLLHGCSLVGSVSVLCGYTFMSVAGALHFGSWHAWVAAISIASGLEPRPLWPSASSQGVALEKGWEHLWPVIAHIVDGRCHRAALRRCHLGASRMLCTVRAKAMQRLQQLRTSPADPAPDSI